MVEIYANYINKIAEKTGFITSTLEKVERLINILQWINDNKKLRTLLALKGGTAINVAIFNFPRLSVDIDLDLNQDVDKQEMLKTRNYINNTLITYLKSNGYKINEEKSKNVYALDSIFVEYTDIKGIKDNIKIEINYTNRTHILETQELKVNTDVFEDKNLTISCVNPIEIYAAKICALINRTTARDLFDIYTLAKYDLFDKEEKQLLKQCFMLYYIAICGYKLQDLKIEKINKISKQDIKTKLIPTLKDRNPKKSNVDVMKNEVEKYLKDILIIDDTIKEFYDKFNKGIYEPELLFKDEEILNRIKNHKMIEWKLKNN